MCFLVQYHLCFLSHKSGYSIEYVSRSLSLKTFAIILAADISFILESHFIIDLGIIFISLKL